MGDFEVVELNSASDIDNLIRKLAGDSPRPVEEENERLRAKNQKMREMLRELEAGIYFPPVKDRLNGELVRECHFCTCVWPANYDKKDEAHQSTCVVSQVREMIANS